MTNHMYSLVKDQMKILIGVASFVALTSNETSVVDNSSWVVVHA